MKLITIKVIGPCPEGLKILVDRKEQSLGGDALVAMLRQKLAAAAPAVAVMLPYGSEFEFEGAEVGN